MFQFKRIFIFSLVAFLVPTLSVAFLTVLFMRLNIDSSETLTYASSYAVGEIAYFFTIWYLATGIKTKPYQHSFIVCILSSLLGYFTLSVLLNKPFISATFAFDTLVSIVILLIATKLGFKNKDVYGNVS